MLDFPNQYDTCDTPNGSNPINQFADALFPLIKNKQRNHFNN